MQGNRKALVARIQQHKNGKTDNLSKITQPTLIQWGKYDLWVPLDNGHKFKELIPNSELIVYEGGHVVMEELPEVTVRDLLKFLKENK